MGDVAEAHAALKAGAAGQIVQVLEAGGHNLGTLPVLDFLPPLNGLVGDRFLIAAGGCADEASMAAALAARADTVCVGTALVATHECDAHDSFKARLVAATGDFREMTRAYGLESMDFNLTRLLRNETMRALQTRASDFPADRAHIQAYGENGFGGQIARMAVDLHPEVTRVGSEPHGLDHGSPSTLTVGKICYVRISDVDRQQKEQMTGSVKPQCRVCANRKN